MLADEQLSRGKSCKLIKFKVVPLFVGYVRTRTSICLLHIHRINEYAFVYFLTEVYMYIK